MLIQGLSFYEARDIASRASNDGNKLDFALVMNNDDATVTSYGVTAMCSLDDIEWKHWQLLEIYGMGERIYNWSRIKVSV